MSGSVVFTGLFFPDLMLSQSRPISKIIFFMSFCDMVGSISASAGFPQQYTSCTTQATISRFFFSSSWIWTAVLVFQLRCALMYNKIWLRMHLSHAVSWTISFIVALVPLFGHPTELKPSQVLPCYLERGSKLFLFGFSAFEGTFFTCLVLMVLWTLELYFHFQKNGFPSGIVYGLYQKTLLYPIGVLITWFPILISILFYQDADSYKIVLLILSTQSGLVLALIFFSSCPEARLKWALVYRRYVFKRRSPTELTTHLTLSNDGDDFDDSIVSIDQIVNILPGIEHKVHTSLLVSFTSS